MTSPCKPSAGFWITVALVAVLVGYLLSFGPACWLHSYDKLPGRAVAQFYRPILLLCHNESPTPVRDFVFWYGDLVRPPYFNAWPTAMVLCDEARIPCLLIPPP